MGRIRVTLVAAVLGGAAWMSGFGSAANATQPCAQVASVNSDIQRGAHGAGVALRRHVHGDLNSIGGDLSGELNEPGHTLVIGVCNILP